MSNKIKRSKPYTMILSHSQPSVSKTKALGCRYADYNNTLSLSVKICRKGIKMAHTSYAPAAQDRQTAIQDSISAEIMLSTVKAADQRSKRTGYAEARKQRNSNN
jgi:hypothetical protein